MSPNSVLDGQGDPVDQGAAPLKAATTAAAPDPVRVLAEAVQRPGSLLYRAPGTPAKRPFDAQYWACWLIVSLCPVLLAYFWLTR